MNCSGRIIGCIIVASTCWSGCVPVSDGAADAAAGIEMGVDGNLGDDPDGGSPPGPDGALPDGAADPPDAGPPGPELPAGALRTSTVWFSSYAVGQVQVGQGTATFLTYDPAPFPQDDVEVVGPCRVRRTAGSVQARRTYDDAGRITLEGAAIPVALDLEPGAPFYAAHRSEARLWQPGDRLTVRAAGGTIPPFVAELSGPAHVSIVAPPHRLMDPVEVDRQSPLEVVWSGDSPGMIRVMFQGPFDPEPHVHIVCDFDAEQGRGAVPAAALATLPAGDGAIMSVGVVSEVVVPTAGWGDVTIRLEAAALGSRVHSYSNTLRLR